MPLVSEGALRGCYAPENDGGSALNMLSSLIRSRGGNSPHPELDTLPASRLASARHVVYLLVDGLGSAQVEAYLARRSSTLFLGQAERRTMTTLFPTTTATVVTTWATGASPAEHGVIGWHVHLPDLGVVSTILLGTSRAGAGLWPPGFDLRTYLAIPSYVETVPCRRLLLTYGDIASRPYNRALTTWDRALGYDSLPGLVESIASVSREPEPTISYAYWPKYDSMCHKHGPEGDASLSHLDDVDAALARVADAIRGTGTVLCVSADHGFETTPRERFVDLHRVPGFASCLAVAPSGDPRQVSCFVRPARVRTFLDVVANELGDAASVVPGEVLLASGVLGPGTPHPALADRIGDYVLLARDGWAFGWSIPGGPPPEVQAGNHGGMSRREMLVPLYVID